MAIYFIKVKGQENYIKHESQMASTMYDEIEEMGYKVEEAFVHHDNNLRWSKVIPKNAERNHKISGFTLTGLEGKDYEIDYERLAKHISEKLIYFLSEPMEINIDDYLVRF